MTRKIIHIDMDCFYAAVEMRDDPNLRNKPVAVGGSSSRRGVLCTCNYAAREFGVHSAMPTARALQLCPDLVLLPVNMDKYKVVSKDVREIFAKYTDLVEPLSLDEAYLDVTDSEAEQNSATLIAKAIRDEIETTLQLTASAGVAPNKFLAKIASDWRKPNGIFVIRPEQVEAFVLQLPVKKIFGVGKVTQQKLHDLSIFTCADLQQWSETDLSDRFGKFGRQLYQLARGVDERPVNPHRIRKSVSVEHTYVDDIHSLDQLLTKYTELKVDLEKRSQQYQTRIKSQFIKLKFSDFQTTTVEQSSQQLSDDLFLELIKSGWARRDMPVRLLGIGFHLEADEAPRQEILFQ